MLALQALTPQQLAASVPAITLAEARKLVAQAHRGEPIAATSAIRRVAADAVRAVAEMPQLEVIAETPSQIDPFVKYLVAAGDGSRFETVRIPLEDPTRFVACVSSQVGCALACAFCATGRLGLTRNLETWEIVEQVRIVRARLSHGRVHGVVFQGMGEPLANLDAVLGAIAVLTEPCALGIDARAITVCTAGLPVGIRRLAREAPNVRLGISISSAIGAHRRSLMPIDRAHDLEDVLAAAAEHARLTNLSPMWAVTLLEGVNDSDEDARALADRARAFEAETGKRPRLSIIAYNSIGAEGDDPFRRSIREREFRAALGFPSHRRYSGGGDVQAACGQLAARS
ncbi:MAG: Ribosomal large subunit methyltransferase [Myxococcales bacterium]|nr:Ribosomal large subunit methyltransferase [Myxococcales bacterium]